MLSRPLLSSRFRPALGGMGTTSAGPKALPRVLRPKPVSAGRGRTVCGELYFTKHLEVPVDHGRGRGCKVAKCSLGSGLAKATQLRQCGLMGFQLLLKIEAVEIVASRAKSRQIGSLLRRRIDRKRQSLGGGSGLQLCARGGVIRYHLGSEIAQFL